MSKYLEYDRPNINLVEHSNFGSHVPPFTTMAGPFYCSTCRNSSLFKCGCKDIEALVPFNFFPNTSSIHSFHKTYINPNMFYAKCGLIKGSGGQERDATLNQLLVSLDGFEGRGNIIIIASTN